MMYNTIDGNPPMSLKDGGTNAIQPPNDIVQKLAFLSQLNQNPNSNSPSLTPDQMAMQASQMPIGINGPDDRTRQYIENVKALQGAGILDTPYQKALKEHPILMGLSNAMMAMGQSLTGQPIYTSNQQNQAALQKASMDMIGEAAKYGQMTPEQQFVNQMRMQQMQNMQDQRDQTNWTQLINKINPATASSRSTLGMAANGNLRADRALATIQNNPNMTYQDLGNVVGDLSAIYSGGAPTDLALSHNSYNTLQGFVANLKQWATGQPQAAVPPAIRQKIMDTIGSLKDVNNKALTNYLDTIEKGQGKLISKHQDEWSQFRGQIESDYMNGGNSNSAQQPIKTPSGKLNKNNLFEGL